uniref:Uncharacterized protein n=1 Tax=Taeniopygia guttata TaxID=59729 RepID=A0A674HP89_TAEGU
MALGKRHSLQHLYQRLPQNEELRLVLSCSLFLLRHTRNTLYSCCHTATPFTKVAPRSHWCGADHSVSSAEMITTERSPSLAAGLIPAALQRKPWITASSLPSTHCSHHQQLRAGLPDTALCQPADRSAVGTEVGHKRMLGPAALPALAGKRARENQGCLKRIL